MFNKNRESKERYSLRKYKGVGAASVLLGALAITHPALAADPAPTEVSASENTNSTTEKDDAKKYEADSGVRDNNDGTSTIYNRDASYTLPAENIVHDKTREPGYVDKYGRHVYEYNEEEYNKYNEQGEKLAKEQYAKNEEATKEGSEDFKDTTVKYVTTVDGKEVEIKDATVEDTDGNASYKVNGRFGKKYTGTDVAFDESKIKSDDVITTADGKVYHKIDTVVTKGDGTATKTKLNDVELNITPKGLHKEDGSIDYSKIKDGARIFLVTETDEGKYDKYLVINKDSNTNDTSITDLFKAQEINAKTFNKETLEKDGGVKDGDIILVVEKNEFAVLPDKEKKRERSYTTITEVKSIKDYLKFLNGYMWENYNLDNDYGRDWIYDMYGKREVYGTSWKDYYNENLLSRLGRTTNKFDEERRLIYGSQSEFYGEIGKGDKILTYDNLNKFINDLIKEYGPIVPKQANWGENAKVDIKFLDDIDRYKDADNYDVVKKEVEAIQKEHEKIKYVDNVPEEAKFIKDIYEINTGFGVTNSNKIQPLAVATKFIDYVNPGEFNYLKDSYKASMWYNYWKEYGDINLGGYYKEYEKDGQIYRVAKALLEDQGGTITSKSLEVHYYDFYTPLRAYTVNSKANEVKNIYAEEKSRDVVKEGNVVVHYKTADGTKIQDDATLNLADNVVSKGTSKYYVDKDGNEVVLPLVSSAGPVATGAKYDASSLKTARIQLANGKIYKLAASKTAADSGVLKEGITDITYVYELAKGDVTVKYEDEKGTSLAADVKLFTQADSGTDYNTSANKKDRIQKDNKVYKFSKLKDGSATETGKVSDVPTVVTYVYSEVSPKVDENVANKLGTVIVKYVDDKGALIDEVKVADNVVVEKGTQTSYEGYSDLTKTTYEKTNAQYSTVSAKKDSLEYKGHTYNFKKLLTKEEAAKYASGLATTNVEKGTLAEGTTVLVYQYDYLIDVTVPSTPNNPDTPTDPTNPNTPNNPIDPTSKVPEVPKKTYKDLDLIRDVKRTITYVYGNGPHKGEKASDDVTQTARFVRSAKINRATGKVVTYGNWTPAKKLAEVVSKDIAGYDVDTGKVSALEVDENSKDVVVEVKYTAQQSGKVVVKYLVKGTDTEVKDSTTLPSNFVGETYKVEAPKAGERVQKDGKTYLYKERRATSDAESGTLTKEEKVVIYDYVELTMKEESRVEEIPFETEVKINKFLKKGEQNILQKGQNGSYEVYRIDTYAEGKLLEVGKEQERNKKAPIKEIIEVGTLESATGEPPKNDVDALATTRHLIEGTNENIADPEVGYTEHKEGVIKHGDKRYFFARTEEKDGIRTHYYKEFKDAIPGHKDNGLEDTGEVPTNEVGVLATTRHLIEGTTTNLFDPEEGTTANKADSKTRLVEKDGQQYFFVNTVEDEENAITTHYYRLVETKVPEAPSEDELPILKTTRHLIEGTTTNIIVPELGTTEHKTGVLEYEGKNYQFSRTESEDKNGITTHYYKLVETSMPEPPKNEVDVLKTTRHLIEGTNESIADPEVGYTEHKEGKVNFKDKEYEYVSTEEKDNIRTHYYKEVKKVVTPTPENPHEDPSEPQNPQERPSNPQNRPENPQQRPSEPQNRPEQPQENSDEGQVLQNQERDSQKQLPNTKAATNNVATLGLGLVALVGLALRRKIK